MNIKKIYFDMRIGQTVIFPIISMMNFIIISYSLTDVSKFISMEIYVPIVIIGMIMMLIVIGGMFRKKQQSTDFTVAYENNPELIKDLTALLSDDEKLKSARIKYHEEILKRHETS